MAGAAAASLGGENASNHPVFVCVRARARTQRCVCARAGEPGRPSAGPPQDRVLPDGRLALANADDAPPDDQHRSRLAEARLRVPPERAPRVASPGLRRLADCAPPAEPELLGVHPPGRGRLAIEYRQRLLRRPPDGPRVPADVRAGLPSAEGNGRPLVASRADLGRRARTAERSRLRPLAEHRPDVWAAVIRGTGPV